MRQESIRDLQGDLSVVRCIDRTENIAHVSNVFLWHLKRHQHESSLLQFPVPDSGWGLGCRVRVRVRV